MTQEQAHYSMNFLKLLMRETFDGPLPAERVFRSGGRHIWPRYRTEPSYSPTSMRPWTEEQSDMRLLLFRFVGTGEGSFVMVYKPVLIAVGYRNLGWFTMLDVPTWDVWRDT